MNVLLALAWPTHQFHGAATARLEREANRRWATCALTELGFVRISCNAGIMGLQQSPSAALVVLEALTADRQHVYLDGLPPLASAGGLLERIVGHQQVTDAYLLAVAKARSATLLTFDSRLHAIDPDGRDVETLS